MINLEKFKFLNLLSQKPSFLRRLLMGDTLHLRCLETKDFCLYTKSFVRFFICLLKTKIFDFKRCKEECV